MLVKIESDYDFIILDVDVTGKETFKYLLQKIKKEYISTRIKIKVANGKEKWQILDIRGKCVEIYNVSDVNKKVLINMIYCHDTNFSISLPIEILIEKFKENNIYCKRLEVDNETYSI